MMPSLAFFEWCETTWLGAGIRASEWLFPVIESVHLLALAAIGGAILLVDLRMLGVGLRHRPVAELSRDAEPWLAWGLVVMLTTGVLLFLSEAVKCYYSPAFFVKINTIPVALVYTATVRRAVANADEVRIRPVWRAITALISLALWFTIGAAGRWIGFS